MTPVEIIEGMIDLLGDERAWCKGTLYEPQFTARGWNDPRVTARCVRGAHLTVIGASNSLMDFASGYATASSMRVAYALDTVAERHGYAGGRVDWNNAPETTHADLIAGLKEARLLLLDEELAQ